MSEARKLNKDAPIFGIELVRVYEIGWEHEIVESEDGAKSVVLTLDEAGEPIPRSYAIEIGGNAEQVLDRWVHVDWEQVTRVGKEEGGYNATVELIGFLVGRGVIEQIATDPTVPPEVFFQLLDDLTVAFHLDEMLNIQRPPLEPGDGLGEA